MILRFARASPSPCARAHPLPLFFCFRFVPVSFSFKNKKTKDMEMFSKSILMRLTVYLEPFKCAGLAYWIGAIKPSNRPIVDRSLTLFLFGPKNNNSMARKLLPGVQAGIEKKRGGLGRRWLAGETKTSHPPVLVQNTIADRGCGSWPSLFRHAPRTRSFKIRIAVIYIDYIDSLSNSPDSELHEKSTSWVLLSRRSPVWH